MNASSQGRGPAGKLDPKLSKLQFVVDQSKVVKVRAYFAGASQPREEVPRKVRGVALIAGSIATCRVRDVTTLRSDSKDQFERNHATRLHNLLSGGNVEIKWLERLLGEQHVRTLFRPSTNKNAGVDVKSVELLLPLPAISFVDAENRSLDFSALRKLAGATHVNVIGVPAPDLAQLAQTPRAFRLMVALVLQGWVDALTTGTGRPSDYKAEVKRLLDAFAGPVFVLALCADKGLGSEQAREYFQWFIDCAKKSVGGQLSVCRIFVGSRDGWSLETRAAYDAHVAAAASGTPILALQLPEAAIKDLGATFGGIEWLLSRGWGFVVMRSGKRGVVVMHEGSEERFCFTTSRQAQHVGSALDVLMQLVPKTQEYETNPDMRSRLDAFMGTLS